ncbi:MAG: hypothetical protein GY842_16550 [bacterium]|nr:hypothetical protein [bacterium]
MELLESVPKRAKSSGRRRRTRMVQTALDGGHWEACRQVEVGVPNVLGLPGNEVVEAAE